MADHQPEVAPPPKFHDWRDILVDRAIGTQ
jgi:hypothetical protein